MALYSPERDFSDDEIFFGKLSIKEVKKHISFKNHRQSVSCITENKLNASEDSVKVIETHSEPDIYSVRDDSINFQCNSISSLIPAIDCDKSMDDSFLKLEKLVTEMSETKNKKNEELDNTLEVVEFILKNTPHKDNINDNVKEADNKHEENNVTTVELLRNSKTDDIELKHSTLTDECKDEYKTRIELQIEKLYDTPLKKSCKVNNVSNAKTPSINTQAKDFFKTPKNPLPIKNCLSSSKKTPSRLQAFQHITSPVASYIKSCPQVPLLKDVRPKKHLPGCSSIPKLIKNPCDKHKEDVALPSIAYKSAKKTKMITIPDKEKLPQNAWANKIASSLQKPVIIKHDHRENNKSSKNIIGNQKDDSFANLSLHQADLSVCTQKSAVYKSQV